LPVKNYLAGLDFARARNKPFWTIVVSIARFSTESGLLIDSVRKDAWAINIFSDARSSDGTGADDWAVATTDSVATDVATSVFGAGTGLLVALSAPTIPTESTTSVERLGACLGFSGAKGTSLGALLFDGVEVGAVTKEELSFDLFFHRITPSINKPKPTKRVVFFNI
jgi:hypothetical protein